MQLEADTPSGLFILRTSNHTRWPDADAEAMMHRGWHDPADVVAQQILPQIDHPTTDNVGIASTRAEIVQQLMYYSFC